MANSISDATAVACIVRCARRLGNVWAGLSPIERANLRIDYGDLAEEVALISEFSNDLEAKPCDSEMENRS